MDQVTKYLVLSELTYTFDGTPGTGNRVGLFFSQAPAIGLRRVPLPRKAGDHRLRELPAAALRRESGAAFGLFRGLPEGARGPLFHLVSIGAVLLITFYFSKLSGTKKEELWALWGLPLVLGGAIGNYLDRLARGFVIDFLEAHWFDKVGWTWPSFNVADMAICVGGRDVGRRLVRSEGKEELQGLKEPPCCPSSTSSCSTPISRGRCSTSSPSDWWSTRRAAAGAERPARSIRRTGKFADPSADERRRRAITFGLIGVALAGWACTTRCPRCRSSAAARAKGFRFTPTACWSARASSAPSPPPGGSRSASGRAKKA